MSDIGVHFPAVDLVQISQLKKEKLGKHDWVQCWCRSQRQPHVLWNDRSPRILGLGTSGRELCPDSQGNLRGQ